MNYRFSQKIELISTIPPELTDCLILKSILQPLAENSIRHGFSLDESGCIPVPMPEISIGETFTTTAASLMATVL